MKISEIANKLYFSDYNQNVSKLDKTKIYQRVYKIYTKNKNFDFNKDINIQKILNTYSINKIAKKLFNSKYNHDKLTMWSIYGKIQNINEKYNKKFSYDDIINNDKLKKEVLTNIYKNNRYNQILKFKDTKVNKYKISKKTIIDRFTKNKNIFKNDKDLINKIYNEKPISINAHKKYVYKNKKYTLNELVQIGIQLGNKKITRENLYNKIVRFGEKNIEKYLQQPIRNKKQCASKYKVILCNNIDVSLNQYLSNFYKEDKTKYILVKDKIVHKLRYYNKTKITEKEIKKVIKNSK